MKWNFWISEKNAYKDKIPFFKRECRHMNSQFFESAVNAEHSFSFPNVSCMTLNFVWPVRWIPFIARTNHCTIKDTIAMSTVWKFCVFGSSFYFDQREPLRWTPYWSLAFLNFEFFLFINNKTDLSIKCKSALSRKLVKI
jgi:hypothetical protein